MRTLCIISMRLVLIDPYTPYDAYVFVHGWYVAYASLVPDHLPAMPGVRSVQVMSHRMCEMLAALATKIKRNWPEFRSVPEHETKD